MSLAAQASTDPPPVGIHISDRTPHFDPYDRTAIAQSKQAQTETLVTAVGSVQFQSRLVTDYHDRRSTVLQSPHRQHLQTDTTAFLANHYHPIVRRCTIRVNDSVNKHIDKTSKLIHQPTYAPNKIHSRTNIKLLHDSAPGCHHQGVMLNKGAQAQHANGGITSPLLE
jgi:hypothetical protein